MRPSNLFMLPGTKKPIGKIGLAILVVAIVVLVLVLLLRNSGPDIQERPSLDPEARELEDWKEVLF